MNPNQENEPPPLPAEASAATSSDAAPPPLPADMPAAPHVVPADLARPLLTASRPIQRPPFIFQPVAALPVVEQPIQPKTVTWGFWLALSVLAVLNLLTFIHELRLGVGPRGAFYVVGEMLGCFLLWPAFIWGLFCIGKQFRTRRTLATIAIVLWSLSLISRIGKINTPAPARVVPAAPNFSADIDPRFFTRNPAQPQWPTLHGPSRPLKFPELRAASAARVPVSTANDARAPDDFSAGSDERFLKQVTERSEERYRQIVAAYREACAQAPTDVHLARERISFIEHFAFAEDDVMPHAEDDLKEADDYFRIHFFGTPEYVLYDLRNPYDVHFEPKADNYEQSLAGWPPKQLAQFYLLRARSADHLKKPESAARFAAASLALDRSAQTVLLLARELHAQSRDADAIAVLRHWNDLTASLYEQKQRMTLLFQMHDFDNGLVAYRELRGKRPAMVTDEVTGGYLAEAGDIDDARKIFSKVLPTEFEKGPALRRRFEFAVKYGDGAEAARAYDALRDSGWKEDPLANDRWRLFRKFPLAPWHLGDAGSVLTMASFLALALASPFLLFAPVHYWSLLRRREPASIGAVRVRGGGWGLFGTCSAFGLLLLSQCVAFWYYSPTRLRLLLTNAPAGAAAPEDLLHIMIAYWVCAVAVIGFLILRRRSLRIFGVGSWSWGTSIGFGFLAFIALRLALGVYVVAFPNVTGIAPAAAGQTAPIIELMKALYTQLGPWALIGIAAVAVPVIEEFFFRGMLLPALNRHVSFWAANAMQALLFASLHGLLGLLPFFILFALVSGELTRRSGGLFASIVLHMLNNLSVCLVLIRVLHAK